MTHEHSIDPEANRWNYRPATPIPNTSIFQWPPYPGFLVEWLVKNWLTLCERVVMAFLAVATWVLLYPTLETAKTFAFGWVAQVWAINMGMMIVIAGGLHWYFFARKGQGLKLKYDKREMGRGNKLWSFRIRFMTIFSGVLGPVWRSSPPFRW